MATRKVNYLVLKVVNRPGKAVEVLGALAAGKVNLLAFTGFPDARGKSQLDLVTDDLAGARRVAKKQGWKVGAAKRGFLTQGKDSIGVVHRQIRALARQGINVTAVDAVAAGRGRFGMILWVKPKDYARAARALRAK